MATTEDRDAAESLDAWRENVYERAPERTDELFSTISGIENDPLSTPENADVEYARDLDGIFRAGPQTTGPSDAQRGCCNRRGHKRRSAWPVRGGARLGA